MKISICIFAVILSIFINYPAQTKCTLSPFSSSGSTKSEGETDGATCSIRFSSTYAFKESSIVKKPKNGILEHINVYSFDYTPNKNFKGVDEYALKICTQVGCSVFNYKITVN